MTNKTKKTNVADPEKKVDDFSFETEAEKAVDDMFKNSGDGEKPETKHITEKIRRGLEIKENLPDKGYLEVKAERGTLKFIDKYGDEREEKKVLITSKDVHDVKHFEISDGLFSMDFRNDCNFWFNRSCVTVPAMIKQSVHTHVDIKKCYDMEKRKIELPWILILALIGGAIIIVLMLFSLMS